MISIVDKNKLLIIIYSVQIHQFFIRKLFPYYNVMSNILKYIFAYWKKEGERNSRFA